MIYQYVSSSNKRAGKRSPEIILQKNQPGNYRTMLDQKQESLISPPAMKISHWIDYNMKNEGFSPLKKPNAQKLQRKTNERQLKLYTPQEAIHKNEQQYSFKLPDTSHKLNHPNQRKDLPGQYLQEDILWDQKTITQMKGSRFLQKHPQIVQEQKRRREQSRVQKIKLQENRIQKLKEQAQRKRQISELDITEKEQLKLQASRINEFFLGNKKKSRMDQYNEARVKKSQESRNMIQNTEKVNKQSLLKPYKEQEIVRVDNIVYVTKIEPNIKQSESFVQKNEEKNSSKIAQKTDIAKIQKILWKQKHKQRINLQQYQRNNRQKIFENEEIQQKVSSKKRFFRQQAQQSRSKAQINQNLLRRKKSKDNLELQQCKEGEIDNSQQQNIRQTKIFSPQQNIKPKSVEIDQKFIWGQKKKTQSIRNYDDYKSPKHAKNQKQKQEQQTNKESENGSKQITKNYKSEEKHLSSAEQKKKDIKKIGVIQREGLLVGKIQNHSVFVHKKKQETNTISQQNLFENPNQLKQKYPQPQRQIFLNKNVLQQQKSHKRTKTQKKQQNTHFIKRFESTEEKQQSKIRTNTQISTTVVEQETISLKRNVKIVGQKSQLDLSKKIQGVSPELKAFSINNYQSSIQHPNMDPFQKTQSPQRSLVIAFSLRKIFKVKMNQYFNLIKQKQGVLKMKTEVFAKILTVSISKTLRSAILTNLAQSLIKIKSSAANSCRKDLKQAENYKKGIINNSKNFLPKFLAILTRKKIQYGFKELQKVKTFEKFKAKAINTLHLLFNRKMRQKFTLFTQNIRKNHLNTVQKLNRVDNIAFRYVLRIKKLIFNKMLTGGLQPIAKKLNLKKKISKSLSEQSLSNYEFNSKNVCQKGIIDQSKYPIAINLRQNNSKQSLLLQNNIKNIQLKINQKKQYLQKEKKRFDQELQAIREKVSNQQQQIKQKKIKNGKLKQICHTMSQSQLQNQKSSENINFPKQQISQLRKIYFQMLKFSSNLVQLRFISSKYGLHERIDKQSDLMKQFILFEQNCLLRTKVSSIEGNQNEQRMKISLFKLHKSIEQMLRGHVRQIYLWEQVKQKLKISKTDD